MKFLDESGLEYLWGKIQNYSDAAASNAVDGLFVGNTSKINATYLPSYVDDVVEFDGYEDHTGETGFNPQANSVPSGTQFKIVYDKGNKQFYGKVEGDPAVYYYFWPETEGKAKYTEDFNNNGKGDKGKIYVDASTNKQYRWAGQDAGLVELSTASAVYYPANSNLTTVSKLGDIAANTSAQTLSGKTISQILDSILFVTDVPTITAASGGAIKLQKGVDGSNNPTYYTDGELVLEGTSGIALSNLTFSVNQAKTDYKYVVDPSTGAINKNSTANQQITLTENDGTLTKELSKKDIAGGGSPIVINEVPSHFVEGIYYYKATQDIQAIDGVSYIDNKGESYTYTPPTTSFNKTVTINVTKPVYSNGTLGSNSDYNATGSISKDSELTKHTANIIENGKTVVIKFGTENNTDGYREIFEYPNTKTITKVEYFDTVANTWKTVTAGTYTSTASGAETSNYNRWTTIGSVKQGARAVRFTLNNA